MESGIIKGKIGFRTKGSLEARPLKILLKDFLNHEEIWGYDGIKKSNLNQEWSGNWRGLLKLVTRSYKNKIRYVHPDINDKEKEISLQLTSSFNLIKQRLKNKIHPQLIPMSITERGRLRPQRSRAKHVGHKRECINSSCNKEFIVASKHLVHFCSQKCRLERRSEYMRKYQRNRYWERKKLNDKS